MLGAAAAALVGAMASGSVACSSSSSNNSSSGGSALGDGGTPTITITSPAANAMVTPAGNQAEVDVAFTLTNFTLVMPLDPSCANGSDNCGHIHILVDGSACTPMGAPYNNDAVASPGKAILTSCPMVAGMHKITLELHHNDHSPVIVGGASGAVSASVTVTAQ